MPPRRCTRSLSVDELVPAITILSCQARPRRSNLAASKGTRGKYLGMRAVLAVIAAMLLAPAARADERVPIPTACRELANRAGLPLTLSRDEAARAVAYIRVMISADPAVARCRLALRSY